MSQAVPILVPRLGLTVTEVTLIEWSVPDGGTINEGDPVCVVETDKVENELSAPATGRLQRLSEPQDVRPVGAVIGNILVGCTDDHD